MLPEKTKAAETEVKETTLPEACMVCGGDLALKVSPGRGASSYCKSCHWFGKPEVTATATGLKVTYKPGGFA
jgi:hypothetical protein